MRSVLVSLVLLLPAFALADSFPSRKPGLWEIESSHGGTAGDGGHKVKQCIDASTDAAMMQSSQGTGGKDGKCAKQEIHKAGETYVIDSDCTVMGRHVMTHGVFKGDFDSHYTAEVNSTFDPPAAGVAERSTTLTARWLGPCAPGQEPGDLIMPNGMKFNLAGLPRSAKRAQTGH